MTLRERRPPTHSGRAPSGVRPALVVVALLIVAGAMTSAGFRRWTHRRDPVAEGPSGPADEGDIDAPLAGRAAVPPPAALALEPRSSVTVAVDRNAPPPPIESDPGRSGGAALPKSLSPPAKRLDVSPAGLAAERSRIALAALAPREDRLVRSGPPSTGAPPAWLATADALRDELGRSLIANAGVRVSGLTCFQAGCLFSFDAAEDMADVQTRGRLKMLLRGETSRPFSGDSFVSGAVIRPDGYLRTTVILYAPDAASDDAVAWSPERAAQEQ